MSETKFQPLTNQQVDILQANGCSAQNWDKVLVSEKFSPEFVHQARFEGDVSLGDFSTSLQIDAGVTKQAGVYNACLINCTVSDGTRVANIGRHIANYNIAENACIEDVGQMITEPGSCFGNGTEVEALNEGGGREVTLFNELSAQFAYLQCLVKWRPKLSQSLSKLADNAANAAKSDRGSIGTNAVVASVPLVKNVCVGPYANVQGASSLCNGTILSSQEAKTVVGAGVVANDFILAEGASVKDAAIVASSFVGQGTQIGKQFSAEGSLFFANCEGFHGEACSVFAGPYTVTHHKSTLLIAGLFSFYNAGSGTNQSNHMYKLGPVHEGKFERGCKTGSFSYVMWPCRVGPFSVVLGKHTRTFDTRNFPFSHIEAKSDGRCELIPGMYLSTVGTVRDGQKWPSRDRRTANVKRDIIDFDVFSPLTVGRMLRGTATLKAFMESTERSVKFVSIEGADVRRVLLRTGVKNYKAGIEMYLLEKLVTRYEKAKESGNDNLATAFAVNSEAVFSEEWIDLAGQMMPQSVFEKLCDNIESGNLDSIEKLQAGLAEIHNCYEEDEWAWVVWAYEQHFGTSLLTMTKEDLKTNAENWKTLRTKFLKMILSDTKKEFEEATQTGFGVFENPEDASADFAGVRGTYEQNKFVKQMEDDIQTIANRAEAV